MGSGPLLKISEVLTYCCSSYSQWLSDCSPAPLGTNDLGQEDLHQLTTAGGKLSIVNRRLQPNINGISSGYNISIFCYNIRFLLL